MKSYCTLMVLAIIALSAYTADTGWRDRHGRPVPNTDAQKSVSGFGGALIITPDKDWEEKWNTSPATTPQFNTADRLRVGEALTILILFSNPQSTSDGKARVLCDLRVVRPNKTISVDAKKVECFSGPIQGDPKNLRLTSQFLLFEGERTDVLGKYTVYVTLYDDVANIEVPLKDSFTLAQ